MGCWPPLKTGLQWTSCAERGTATALHAKLEGKAVGAHSGMTCSLVTVLSSGCAKIVYVDHLALTGMHPAYLPRGDDIAVCEHTGDR